MPQPADFEYGNTRLRGRRGDLMGDDTYQELLSHDLAGLVGALGQSGYAVDMSTISDRPGLAQWHVALRTNLGRSMEQLRSFYSGRARELVDVLLTRFDIANIIAVLRAGIRRPDDPADALTALTPVGWLTEPLAIEILRPREAAGVVDLLARAMPDRGQRAPLHAAFQEYERTNDLAAFERAVTGEHGLALLARLGRVGASGQALLRYVQRATDDANLLIALRLREAVSAGVQDTPSAPDTLRPGGSIAPAAFVDAVREPGPAAVAAEFTQLGGRRWRVPLERWAATGDLLAMQRWLERSAITAAIALFRVGDPLAVDVPIAFAAAKQAEVANLRLLGEAAVRGIAADVVRGELFWPGAIA